MPHLFEPHVKPVDIAELRPTQMTVGMREVRLKRESWKAIKAERRPDFLGRHMVPVAIGPKERLYLVDHHHLVRALNEEGIRHVLTSIVADLSHLGKDEFWSVMDNLSLVHPFDAHGVRQPVTALPREIGGLVDDPFRSLAGALREAGGFAKVTVPFSEFLWADFLRRRLERKRVMQSFELALPEAMRLARSREAAHLPGWCGSSRQDA